MSEHTPGPWLISVYSHGPFKGCAAGIYVDEGDDGETEVCEIPQWTGATEEQEANARLIAAAPELLEAADELLRALNYRGADSYDDMAGHAGTVEACMDNLRDAIAKARAG